MPPTHYLAPLAPLARLTAALILTAQISACSEPEPSYQLSGHSMGTSYQIQIAGPISPQQRQQAANAVSAQLQQHQQRYSHYRPDSEVSRFNQQSRLDWVPVSQELAQLVQQAQTISAQTQGAFDITLAPLIELWGFGPKPAPQHTPSDEQIQAARQASGWQKLQYRLQPPALKKSHPKLRIDLSAIAKGNAIDAIAHRLDALKIPNYLIEIGGEVRAKGHNAKHQRWNIGLIDPRKRQRTPSLKAIQALSLNNQSVATSGNSENRLTIDGKTYSHLLDPKTGRPSHHRLASVSVIANNCTQADALATALYIMGPQQGPAFAKQQNIHAIFLIWQDHERLKVQEINADPRP